MIQEIEFPDCALNFRRDEDCYRVSLCGLAATLTINEMQTVRNFIDACEFSEAVRPSLLEGEDKRTAAGSCEGVPEGVARTGEKAC